VRKGDVLLEIDGRAASTSTPVELRNLLNVDGAMRRLVLERDGQRMTVDVRLRSRL
jgi:S1-C subfamily serine protease